MNEYIDVQFRKNGKRLDVKRQLPNGSIELDERDPIERRVSIGLVPQDDITQYRVRRIRQLRDWAPGEFKLRVSAEGGTLVLRGEDRDALPEGRYRLRVALEEAKATSRKPTAVLVENGFCEFLVDIETDDREIRVDLTSRDALIGRVLDTSGFDEQDAMSWLQADDVRPARKACLLNLLASLRVRPVLSDPLIKHVQKFYWASNDRAYARADGELLVRLEELARHPTGLFFREGVPKAEIHKRLITSIPPADRLLFSPDRLVSFRGEGSPSLQTVVAEPPPGHPFVYAEFDLDLGNALQDIVGFVVHMGELLDGKPTNHLDLRKRLVGKKAKTKDYVYYTVVS